MLRSLFFFFLLPIGMFADPGPVTGVGSSIIDWLVQVDDEFYARHAPEKRGGAYWCEPERFERLLEDVKLTSKMTPGGSAGNTIRALSKLGVSCLFASHVGDDPSGAHYCREMHGMGIKGVEKDPNFQTIQILCLITPDGERTFFYPHHLYDWNDVIVDHFRTANWAHFEAYLLWEAPQYCELCLKTAKEKGVTISLDLSSFSVVQIYKEKILEWIDRYVDVLFGNEEEVQTLTGLSPEKGCIKLQEKCPIVVVTKGANGCLIGHKGEVTHVPSFPAKAVDTTGAGDYFSAGFIYGRLHQYPLIECAKLGHRMGSSIIEFVGTDLPESKWSEIRNFLKSDKK